MLRTFVLIAMIVLSAPVASYAVGYSSYMPTDSGTIAYAANPDIDWEWYSVIPMYDGTYSTPGSTTRSNMLSYWTAGSVYEKRVVSEFDISDIGSYSKYFFNISSTTSGLDGVETIQVNYFTGNQVVDSSDFWAGESLGVFNLNAPYDHLDNDIYGLNGDLYIDITDIILNATSTNLGFTISIFTPEISTTVVGQWIREGYILGTNVVPGEVTATPIPGAVWLLGTGLLGMVGIRRFGRSEQ